MKELSAVDILSDKTVSVDAESRIVNVIEKLRESHASHVVIYDGNEFYGVAPLKAALMKNPQRIFADLLPREPLPVIPSCTTIQALGHLFASMPIDAVSVVDEDGAFIGVVSEDSLLRSLLEETQNRLDEMSRLIKPNLEEKIKVYAREKRSLIKELHCRVKSNMQIISSLLSLQLDQINNHHATESVQACISRIKSMTLVHENLYQTGLFADIKFSDYIKTLVDHLIRTYGMTEISTLFDLETISLCMDKAIPCGLILNELVSNCLKHSFPDKRKGEIRLRLLFDTNSSVCSISVHDNGIGLPPDLDYKTAQSSGFLIINILAAQLHGEVDVIREYGTEFILRFPINNIKRLQYHEEAIDDEHSQVPGTR